MSEHGSGLFQRNLYAWVDLYLPSCVMDLYQPEEGVIDFNLPDESVMDLYLPDSHTWASNSHFWTLMVGGKAYKPHTLPHMV